MNGSLGTLLPSSVPSSISSAVRSPEDERRCALLSVGDEHAAVSRAASPAPIKVLLSTLVGSCPLPGLLWLAEAWSVGKAIRYVISASVQLRFAAGHASRLTGRTHPSMIGRPPQQNIR